jgi:pimeloyl-ACP methyl ester carboxylesterase
VPQADVDGLSMFYETRGAGAPLLVIPGLGLEASDLGRVVEALSRRCRVTVIDNRGCGRTASPPGPYSIPQMADDAAGLCARVGLGPTAVLGISMGGKVALDLAIRRPDLVARLVLVSTQPRARRGRTPLAIRLGRAGRVMGIGRGRTPQSVAAFDAQARASAAYDCADRLGDVSAPTLVLHGERDRLAPVAQAREMASRIADARLVTYRGGHLFFLSSSRDAVASAVAGFVTA